MTTFITTRFLWLSLGLLPRGFSRGRHQGVDWDCSHVKAPLRENLLPGSLVCFLAGCWLQAASVFGHIHLSIRAASSEQARRERERERERNYALLEHKLRSDIPLLCHIPFGRSKSLGPAHTQGEG